VVALEMELVADNGEPGVEVVEEVESDDTYEAEN
jgi:hypothetical protein